jgi:outer membrane lipoprotein-sorting protein
MTGSTHVRITLALVLAVSLAGCGATNLPFLGDGDDGDGRAEAIATDAVAEMQNVSTYNFSMRQVVSFGQNTLNVTADGTVNHSAQRLYMDVSQSVQTNTTRAKEFTEVYVVDGTRCWADDSVEDGWNESRTTGAWNQGLSVADQATLLNASGTEAALLENQTVRGVDAYVVEISPDADALKRVVANGSDVDVADVAVRNATITQYVAQDDNRLLRSSMNVVFVQEGRVLTLDVTMTYSDYGTATNITFPVDDDGNELCSTNASATAVAA